MRKPAAPGAPPPEPPPPGGRALQRARQFAVERGLEPPGPDQKSPPPKPSPKPPPKKKR